MKTVKSSVFDDRSVDSMIKFDKDFKEYIDWRSNHFNNYEQEHKDIYNYLNKREPKFVEDNCNELMKQYLESSNETMKLAKQTCTGNSSLSYIMSKKLLKDYEKLLDEKFYELKQKQESVDRMDKDSEEYKIANEELKKAINKNKMSMDIEIRIASQSLEKELKKAVQVQSIIDNVGKNAGTCSKKADINQILQLHELIKNNPQIEELINLIGKMMNCAEHNLRTSTDGAGTVCGLKLGGDIEFLLPDEIALMNCPEFAEIKEIEFLQKNLMQFKTRGKQPQSHGPIVVCLDESGSMYGNRIKKSKAYLFGMWKVAKEHGRDFMVVKFGGVGETEVKDVKTLDDMIEVMNSFINSGSTDFNTPLQNVIDIIESDKTYNSADVIFITDGCGDIQSDIIEKFAEFKSSMKFKFISFLFGHAYNTLGKISDKVIKNNFDEFLKETFV